MDARTRRIVEGLEEAMKAETDGYHFYMMAASSTEDEKGKEVFRQLAEEELAHLKFLRQQRDSLATTGTIDRSLELGRPAARSEQSPIFSESLRENAAKAHFEMSALSIGMQLEKAAREHYERLAAESSDSGVAAFYRGLAEWESQHYELLARQMEELKEDYWSSGGFAPW